MPLPTLSALGVAQKQTELYALTQDVLLLELRSMIDDFSAWMSANFDLTAAQASYISGVPEPVAFHWATLFSASLISHGAILCTDSPKKYPPGKRTKQINCHPTGGTGYFPPVTGVGTLTGQIDITIDYTLVP